jgi:hypothetical protein
MNSSSISGFMNEDALDPLVSLGHFLYETKAVVV